MHLIAQFRSNQTLIHRAMSVLKSDSPLIVITTIVQLFDMAITSSHGYPVDHANELGLYSGKKINDMCHHKTNTKHYQNHIKDM